MVSYHYNTKNPTIESGYFTSLDPFQSGLGGFSGVLRGGSSSTFQPQSLVLDSEKGELVKAPARVGKKSGVSEAKQLAALKNHSEAERRRRERINAHLATLRGLVPCTEKIFQRSRVGTFSCESLWNPRDLRWPLFCGLLGS